MSASLATGLGLLLGIDRVKEAPRRAGQGANPSGPDKTSQLGAVIKGARKGRYSLEDLAARAGVSAGLISEIERGMGNPSFVTLTKLAYALDLSIGSFFQTAINPDDMLVRRNARRQLVMPHNSLVYDLLTPSLQGKLGMVRTRISPGFDNREQPFMHPGEESVHLLSGRVEIQISDRLFTMDQGDTITYDSGLPHAWRNPTGEVAEVIAAMTPPSF